MIKRLGIFMGSAFLFGGLLGFVPGVVKDGMYFGMFMVNTPHNILHIASGANFLVASMIGAGATRLWFQVLGLPSGRRDHLRHDLEQSIRQLGACRARPGHVADRLRAPETDPCV